MKREAKQILKKKQTVTVAFKYETNYSNGSFKV